MYALLFFRELTSLRREQREEVTPSCEILLLDDTPETYAQRASRGPSRNRDQREALMLDSRKKMMSEREGGVEYVVLRLPRGTDSPLPSY